MYTENDIYHSDNERIICEDFYTFRGKTFLITGASGLVGTALDDTLVILNEKFSLNLKLILVSRHERKSKYDFIKIIAHDITLSLSTDDKIDYIIHAASNTHPRLYAEQPVETIEVNILGTLNILKLAKKNPDVRTIFLSTLEGCFSIIVSPGPIVFNEKLVNISKVIPFYVIFPLLLRSFPYLWF